MFRDQGLNEGDFLKLQKGVHKRLIEVFNCITPFILVDYPIHNNIISME